jgi:peptide/nickel transport system permease protein
MSRFGRRRTPSPTERAAADEAAKRFELDESFLGGAQEQADEIGEPAGFVEAGRLPGRRGPIAVRSGTRLRDPDSLAVAEDYVDICDGTPVLAARDRPVPIWRQMLEVYIENRLAVVSTIVLAIIVLGCFIGPHFYMTNQTDANTLTTPLNSPPNSHYWLGTDDTGWDVLGRIMYAGQYSLTLGFLAGVITILVGTVYGMISGFFGGVVDAVLMRILDAALAIPYLFLLVALLAIFHNTTTFIILVIGLTGWFGNARIIRGDALVIRDLDYSRAAVSMGGTKAHVIRRHVFPNSISNIVTVGTFSIADAILALSALGFIGFMLSTPAVDWGSVMASGSQELVNGYWWEIYPCAIVFVTVIVCINYMGDALRDIFEVRLRKR